MEKKVEPEGESGVKPVPGFRDRVAEAEASDAAARCAERDAKYPPAPPPWRWERGDIGHAGHYPDGRLVASDGTEILERGGGDGSGRPPNDLSPLARELIRLAPEMEALLREEFDDGCHHAKPRKNCWDCGRKAILAALDAARSAT